MELPNITDFTKSFCILNQNDENMSTAVKAADILEHLY